MDIEKESHKLIYIASKTVLDDLLWTFFGYDKRPLNGKLFSIFRGKGEINRINFLSREFFLYSLATYLLNYNSDERQQIIECINMKYLLSSSIDLSKSFGFNEKSEMVSYFKQGLFDFCDHDYDEFAEILSYRFRNILKNDFKNEWLLGIARMNVHFGGIS